MGLNQATPDTHGDVFSTVSSIDLLCELIVAEFEHMRKKHHHDWYNEGGRGLLKSKIHPTVLRNKELSFVLPSFPFKAQNRDSTLGDMPDLGEELALHSLHNLGERISAIYSPGARIILASDGRLYADLLGISDAAVMRYRDSLLSMYAKIAVGSARRLDWHSLDEAFPDVRGGDGTRSALMETYPQNGDEIFARVYSDEHYKRLYVGFKNLLISELSVDRTGSKRAVEKEAKKRARAMLERNCANADLLKREFPEAIRLSVKHHDTRTGKWGVNLLADHDDVGTPWLNVAVQRKDGSYDYIKKRRAEEKGYVLQYKESTPYYYREA